MTYLDADKLMSDETLAVAAKALEDEVGLPDGFEWPCGSTDEALRPAFAAAVAALASHPTPDGEAMKEDPIRAIDRPHARFCPVEDCRTELTQVRGRRRGSVQWWCWKCERYWKAGVKK